MKKPSQQAMQGGLALCMPTLMHSSCYHVLGLALLAIPDGFHLALLLELALCSRNKRFQWWALCDSCSGVWSVSLRQLHTIVFIHPVNHNCVC